MNMQQYDHRSDPVCAGRIEAASTPIHGKNTLSSNAKNQGAVMTRKALSPLRRRWSYLSKGFLAFGVAILAACTFRGFQPPPSDSEMWEKTGMGRPEVTEAMLACGYPDGSGSDASATLEQSAARFECMKRSGLIRKDGFDFCRILRDRRLKACQPE
jgi:hypothetical protein